jgi:hypothetical protein
MPELHKLTPTLGVLQDRGQRVALLTDGRMSGASGKVLAAIHVTPEAPMAVRWRSCATATWSASMARPARWRCWSMPAPGPRARPCAPRWPATMSATAASCSR